MPPYKHNQSDSSDRLSSSDLSGNLSGDVNPNNSPVRFPTSHRHAKNQRRIHVSRSTHCELESNNVKKITAVVPGFDDWRHTSGGAADDEHDRSQQQKSSPRRSHARRRYEQIPSTTNNGHSSNSFGSSYSAERDIRDIENKVSAVLLPMSNTAERNIRDIESDVLAQHRYSKPSSRHHRSSSSSRRSRRRSSQDESLPSIPSSMASDYPSLATDATNRFNNTTMATMNKYKSLYEAMLKDAVDKDMTNNNNDDASSWVGLGEKGGTVGKESNFKAGSDKQSNKSSLTAVKEHHNSSVASKGAFHNNSGEMVTNKTSFHNSQSSSENKVMKGVIKKTSFHSSVTSNTSKSSNDDDSKVLIPSTPNCTLLVDEMIDGLQVQESLHEDDVTKDGSENKFNSSNKATPMTKKGNNDELMQIVPIKKKRAEDPSSSSSNDVKPTKKPSFHSTDVKPAKKPSFHNKQPDAEKRQHPSSRRRRSARSPSVDNRNNSRGNNRDRSSSRGPTTTDRDRSLSRGPISSDASVTSQQSSRSTSIRNRSRSRSNSRRRSSTPDNADNNYDSNNHNAQDTSTEESRDKKPTKKKGLLFAVRTIKKLAGKVKNTLGELGGISSVHKYKLGERARYKVVKVPSGKSRERMGDAYDVETRTVEVEIMAVHIDAVLDMPYYTIQLPDESRKQTNWDNLMSLAEYGKIKSAIQHHDIHRGDGDDDDDNNSRHRSSSRLRSLSRGSLRRRVPRSRSSSRHKQVGGEMERSSSRQSSSTRRSLSRGYDEDDNKSTSSHRSLRSNSSHKSSRSNSSRRSNNSPGGGGDRSSSGGHRARSPSPFSRREESGGSSSGDRRSHSRKMHSSRSKPTREERSPSPESTSASAATAMARGGISSRTANLDGSRRRGPSIRSRQDSARSRMQEHPHPRPTPSSDSNGSGSSSNRSKHDEHSSSMQSNSLSSGNDHHGSSPQSGGQGIHSEHNNGEEEPTASLSVPPQSRQIVVEDVNEDDDEDEDMQF
mmetsp:Transcript_10638/g.23488  ORF Transcript_10638/g.23488 Transcript_10638/m.23488 type:complete len:1001 (+) Transcript_10638:135-3137(+)|eukprot:CAMPEP_0172313144 /NCGR_PEP_ID=MMETSP1058-20130122/19533_1 /TAXON_ID=83371 /ORGANISM="Detonula confervacea, Strain CCMP 353" /LENGTH=1000 /DNA_ID=CAMNT_0013026749 /DNA_START=52 /DNA_END=3054 /DNA_ORIENTATION=-